MLTRAVGLGRTTSDAARWRRRRWRRRSFHAGNFGRQWPAKYGGHDTRWAVAEQPSTVDFNGGRPRTRSDDGRSPDRHRMGAAVRRAEWQAGRSCGRAFLRPDPGRDRRPRGWHPYRADWLPVAVHALRLQRAPRGDAPARTRAGRDASSTCTRACWTTGPRGRTQRDSERTAIGMTAHRDEPGRSEAMRLVAPADGKLGVHPRPQFNYPRSVRPAVGEGGQRYAAWSCCSPGQLGTEWKVRLEILPSDKDGEARRSM